MSVCLWFLCFTLDSAAINVCSPVWDDLHMCVEGDRVHRLVREGPQIGECFGFLALPGPINRHLCSVHNCRAIVGLV